MKVIRTINTESEPFLVIRDQTYGPNTGTPMLDEEMEKWPEVIEAIQEGRIKIVEV
jgi:hypothetical protein